MPGLSLVADRATPRARRPAATGSFTRTTPSALSTPMPSSDAITDPNPFATRSQLPATSVVGIPRPRRSCDPLCETESQPPAITTLEST